MSKDLNAHWVPTPADPDRPSGPRAWARLDISSPIEKMFRKGTLGQDEATAYARYRAAQVWFRFFIRAIGADGYSPMLGEVVDGSGDPQAAITIKFEAVQERVNTLDVLTIRRFDDLDAVVGFGKTIAQRAIETDRSAKTVRESVLKALDIISGYPCWDKHMQQVQVVAAYPDRDRPKKRLKKVS